MLEKLALYWQQVLPDFKLGLQVTIIGMALVFLALIIVMIVIRLLDRVFRPEEAVATVARVQTNVGTVATVAVTPPASVARPAAEDLGDEAVAIAVAITLEKAKRKIQAPAYEEYEQEAVGEVITVATFDPGPGVWSGQGRLNAMH